MPEGAGELTPTNPLADPLLTDAYEFTMAYAWWKNGQAEQAAVEDLHFRRNPFNGEFTVFAGLSEVVRFLDSYRFSPAHIDRLRALLPVGTDPAFFEWLRAIDLDRVRVRALREGTLAFPRVPLIIVDGPIAQV